MSRIPSETFPSNELERIRAETFVRHIDYHPELGSTNDRAMELANQSGDEFPLLVLAESQTAGRGRGANVWWSSGGALTFSVMLATDVAQLPTERWPQVSLSVGLAVSEALEEILARGVPAASLGALPAVQLKWPNDVYIEGRKICGILAEVPPGSSDKLLLGIGININNSVSHAPDEIQQRATSLSDLTGQQYSLAEVLIAVLHKLESRLRPTTLWTDDVITGWRSRCYLTGKEIQIDNGTRQSMGICQGIDDSGALLLTVDGEVEKHLAGVIHISS